MKKIRIGNGFVLLWKIRRAGVLEDLSIAQNVKLVRYVGRIGHIGREVPLDLSIPGAVRVDITPAIADRLGTYIFALEYDLPHSSAPNWLLPCVADVDAFEIVNRTAIADEISQVDCVTDVLIGLRGKAFEFEDFTEEQLDGLRFKRHHFTEADITSFTQPSTDAAANINDVVIPAVNKAKQDAIDVVADVNERIVPAFEASVLDANNTVRNINEVVIPASEQATLEATNIVVDYNERVVPALNVLISATNTAKQGAIDATQPAIDAAADATREAAKANTAASKWDNFTFTEIASNIIYNEITF